VTLADDRVAREACRILRDMYPGASCSRRLPDVRRGCEASAAAGKADRLVAVEDDADAVASRDVPGATLGGSNEHRGDTTRQEAA
jgi:hypothetical protein